MKKNYLICFTCFFIVVISSTLYSQESQLLVPDFQINDLVNTPISKSSPDIAMAQDGSYIVVWVDTRAGSDIYFQRFSADGLPLGENVLVNDDTNNRGQSEPAIAVDANGDFAIVWGDGRNNQSTRLYLQRYDSAGNALGKNIPVDIKTYILNHQRHSGIAYSDSGNIVVVWEESISGTYQDIGMRIINKQGNYASDIIQVNTAAVDLRQQHASISSNSNGDFIVVWQDYSDDFNWGDIYGQRFDNNGERVGQNFRVNDDPIDPDYSQRDPAVALNDSGRFVVSWKDNRSGNFDILVQFYDKTGNKIGQNFSIDDDPDNLNHQQPALALKADGSCLVTWMDARNNFDIFAQWIDNEAKLIGNNFVVNDDISNGQYNPQIAVDGNDNFTLAWYDGRDPSGVLGVYTQKISSDGNLEGTNQYIPDDPYWNKDQESPVVTTFATGKKLVVWRDLRDGVNDIYGQVYDEDYNPVGANIKINDSDKPYYHQSYDVAGGANDNALVVWTSSYFSGNQFTVLGQLINSNGEKNGSIFVIDSLEKDAESIVLDYFNGSYVLAWKQKEISGNGDINACILDSTGALTKIPFLVNTGDNSAYEYDPDVAFNNSGDFLIAWSDTRDEGKQQIFSQLFNPMGQPKGENVKITEPSTALAHYSTLVAPTDGNRFIVAFNSYYSPYSRVNARFINSDGTASGDIMQISDGDDHRLSDPAIASADSAKIILVWTDQRNGFSQLMGQRLVDTTKVEGNFIITPELEIDQINPSVCLWEDQIFTVWQDARVEIWATNIWANVLKFNGYIINALGDKEFITNRFELKQNYPNPFNPSTTISYQIQTRSEVDLSIYNTLGQKLMTLVSEIQNAGVYQISWDAGQFSSGLYFYKLETSNNVITRRMLLVK